MDPDAALEQIRRHLAEFHARPSSALTDPHELVELVDGLDQWLTRGGFLPAAWRPTGRVTAEAHYSGIQPAPTTCLGGRRQPELTNETQGELTSGTCPSCDRWFVLTTDGLIPNHFQKDPR